jgi:hypothetical protein
MTPANGCRMKSRNPKRRELSMEPEQELRALAIIGTRGREWIIVNHLGGCVERFTGTGREAEAKARELEQARAPSLNGGMKQP